jgi:hypothetical protein
MRKPYQIALAVSAFVILGLTPAMVKAGGSLFKPQPAPPGYPADKWALDQKEQEEKANAPRIPKETAPPPPVTVAMEPGKPRGITDLNSPFGSQQAKIQNAWQDEVNGQWFQAFAGHVPGKKTQGVVWVVDWVNGAPKTEAFNTPIAAGSVRFVQANDTRLTLKADNGETFVFDVKTRQFVAQ